MHLAVTLPLNSGIRLPYYMIWTSPIPTLNRQLDDALRASNTAEQDRLRHLLHIAKQQGYRVY